jgi:hypothetical protein
VNGLLEILVIFLDMAISPRIASALIIRRWRLQREMRYREAVLCFALALAGSKGGMRRLRHVLEHRARDRELLTQYIRHNRRRRDRDGYALGRCTCHECEGVQLRHFTEALK